MVLDGSDLTVRPKGPRAPFHLVGVLQEIACGRLALARSNGRIHLFMR